MSLYTEITAWAIRREKIREEKEQRNKLKLEANGHNPKRHVTFAQFANTMGAMDGSICSVIKLAGDISVARFSEITAQTLADFSGIIESAVTECGENVMRYVNQRVNMLTSVVRDCFKEFTERQEETNGAIFGLYEYNKAMEANNSSRYLELQEENIRLRFDALQQHNIMFNTTIALFENLTEQIQSLKKRQVERPAEPTLPWLMDKSEELIRYGTALKNLQENNIPLNTARIEVVKSLRALLDHNVSISDIGDLIDGKVNALLAA